MEVARQALESGRASSLSPASKRELCYGERNYGTYSCARLHSSQLCEKICRLEHNIISVSSQLDQKSESDIGKRSRFETAVHSYQCGYGNGPAGCAYGRRSFSSGESAQVSTYLSWDGIFTHFSTADEPDTELTIADEKFISFLRFLKIKTLQRLPCICAIQPPLSHSRNSAPT